MSGRLWLWAAVLLLLPAWGWAQTPDAATAPAAAGSPWVRPAQMPDGGTATLDFPGQLQGGSETAAGLDPTAAGEIIHPANPTSLRASLRSLGAPFQGGSTSVAIQFNPYLIAKGYSQVYQQYVDARARVTDRILQDTAVTLVAVPGTPFEGLEYESGRYGTLGAGVSAELLGERSIYGPVYSRCLNAVTTGQTVSKAMFERPDPPEPGESEESWRARSELLLQQQEETNRQILRTIEEGMERCAKEARETTHALFLSLGGRWVTPGLNKQEGDGIAIQRGFAAMSYELLTTSSIELALQGRALYDRPAPGSRMEKWLDAGLSLGLAGKAGTLRLEYVRSLEQLSDTERSRASYAVNARVRLSDEWAVGVNALGEGTTLQKAIDATTLGLVITYADAPVFQKEYSRPAAQ